MVSQSSKIKKKIKLYHTQNGKCFYCSVQVRHPKNTLYGCQIPSDYSTLDHIKPKSQGGPNVISNYVLACAKCNSARADMDFYEFLYKTKFFMLNKKKEKIVTRCLQFWFQTFPPKLKFKEALTSWLAYLTLVSMRKNVLGRLILTVI